MSLTFPLLQQLVKPASDNSQDSYYTTNSHDAIKIAAAILGIMCILIAIVMSVFMYQHYLRRQTLTLSVCQPIRERSTSSDTPFAATKVQPDEQALDIEANVEEPLSPVMQQGLLQRELVRNYGSNLHPQINTFLKPPPPLFR